VKNKRQDKVGVRGRWLEWMVGGMTRQYTCPCLISLAFTIGRLLQYPDEPEYAMLAGRSCFRQGRSS